VEESKQTSKNVREIDRQTNKQTYAHNLTPVPPEKQKTNRRHTYRWTDRWTQKVTLWKQNW